MTAFDSLAELPFDPARFSEWLNDQMRRRRMTGRQLAVFSGVDHTSISRLRYGHRWPSLQTAIRIARGLHSDATEAAAVRSDATDDGVSGRDEPYRASVAS